MIKDRVELSPEIKVAEILQKVKEVYTSKISEDESDILVISDIDGIKIDFKESWLHLRASNTEPIIRIYAEAKSFEEAEEKVAALKK
jgi:phosphomannomutase